MQKIIDTANRSTFLVKTIERPEWPFKLHQLEDNSVGIYAKMRCHLTASRSGPMFVTQDDYTFRISKLMTDTRNQRIQTLPYEVNKYYFFSFGDVGWPKLTRDPDGRYCLTGTFSMYKVINILEQ